MNMTAEMPETIIQPVIETVTVRGAHGGKDFDICHAYWKPEGAPKGTVVAVHGLSRQKRDMDYIARYLCARGYEFYSLDAPGRGGSQWMEDPADYNLVTASPIFAGYLKQLGLESVHWIGTSMGGLVAMTMAAMDMAGAFKSLTLIDITHKPSRAGLDRIISYLDAPLPVFADVAQYEEFVRLSLPLGPVSDEVWRHYAEHQLVKKDKGLHFHFDPQILKRAMIDMKAELDITEGLQKISCPVALVAGSVSDLCGRAEIEALQKLKPEAKLHICEGAGHVPALEDDATQQFILEHIQKAER